MPGIRALDVPPLGGLDRGLDAFAGDLAGQVAGSQEGAGGGRVVAGVQVHGDVVGQRAEVVEPVEGGFQQRGPDFITGSPAPRSGRRRRERTSRFSPAHGRTRVHRDFMDDTSVSGCSWGRRYRHPYLRPPLRPVTSLLLGWLSALIRSTWSEHTVQCEAQH